MCMLHYVLFNFAVNTEWAESLYPVKQINTWCSVLTVCNLFLIYFFGTLPLPDMAKYYTLTSSCTGQHYL